MPYIPPRSVIESYKQGYRTGYRSFTASKSKASFNFPSDADIEAKAELFRQNNKSIIRRNITDREARLAGFTQGRQDRLRKEWPTPSDRFKSMLPSRQTQKRSQLEFETTKVNDAIAHRIRHSEEVTIKEEYNSGASLGISGNPTDAGSFTIGGKQSRVAKRELTFKGSATATEVSVAKKETEKKGIGIWRRLFGH